MDKDHHRHKRQLYAQALSDRSTRMFEPTVLEHLDVFLKLILKSCDSSTPVEMTTQCQYLGFDVIGSLALGQRLNLQTEEKNRVILRLLIAAKTQVNILMHLPAFRFLSPVLQALPSRQSRQFVSALTDVFTARQAQESEQQDLYSILSGPATEGIFENIMGEIIFFMTTGTWPI